MLAPGIEHRTAARDGETDGALRPDVVGFAGFFARGPVLTPTRVEDWGDVTRTFGGFFRLRGKNRLQALGPLSLYGFQQNGGATALIVRLGSRTMSAATCVVPDPATGRTVGLCATSPGAWANGMRVRLGLRVRSRTAVTSIPFAPPPGSALREGAVVRVRGPHGVIGYGRLVESPQGLRLDAVAPVTNQLVVEELDPRVDVDIAVGDETERFPALSLLPEDPAFVWSVLKAPDRRAPEWLPRVPPSWAPLSDELSLALAQQGPGASMLLRASYLPLSWNEAILNATLLPPPWRSPAEETILSASSNPLFATLNGGKDQVRDADVECYRSGVDAIVQHPLPSIVAVPDLMLSVVRAEDASPRPATRLPLPPPALPRAPCGDPPPWGQTPSPPQADYPPEALEEDDLPSLAGSIAMLQREFLAAVGTAGEGPAERILILDPLPNRSVAGVLEDARELVTAEVTHPELGVLFYPWLEIIDPLAPAGDNIVVPPSGHAAGIMARTTRARGPAAPFANMPLAGVVGAERTFEADDRARLNAGQVSLAREVTGRGVMLFGERSLEPRGPTLRFVPPARVLAYLRRVLRITGETLVFEPNDRLLALRIAVTLESSLRELFAAGAFAGRTPAESYRVRCDRTTTLPADRDLGRIIAHVDVALSVPLEFITVRVAFSRDGASVLDDISSSRAS